MDDLDDIARFAGAIYDGEDIVELRVLRGKGESAQEWCRAADLANPASGIRLWIARHVAEKWNIYIGANPRIRMGGASAEDVALARCFFVDFDGVGPEEAGELIRKAGLPPPTLLIASGGGAHAYWRLTYVITDWGVWKGVQKRLIALLGGDRVIHDTPRIMRLPGTPNYKYTPAVPCKIVHVRDIIESIGVEPIQEGVRYLPARPATVASPTNADWQQRLSRSTRDFIASGAPEGRRNAELFKATCDLAGNGASFDQVMSLLLEPARRCGLEDWEVEGSVRSAFSKPRSPSKPPKAIEPGHHGKPNAEPAIEVAGVCLVVTGATNDGRVIISLRRLDGTEVWRDKVDANSARSRKSFAKSASEQADLPDTAVEEIDRAILIMPEPTAPGLAPHETDPAAALEARDEHTESLLDAMPSEVIAEAERMLADPELVNRVLDDIRSLGVVGEEELALTAYLQGCGRLLPSPFSVRVQGTSSSGKSHVIERVSILFPGEHVLRATDLTPNALYYLPFGSLMHTLVVAGERSRVEDDDKAEAKRALREMISAKVLNKVMPIKMADGSMQTKVIHQPGPIAFIESTTSTRIFEEDENRCLQLSTDESPEQTKRIVAALTKAAAGTPLDIRPVVLRHLALQRMLRRVRVVIPYAEALGEAMPTNKPEARRAIGLMLGLIQAVALLHQRQRAPGGIRHGDEITATIADYVVARRLLMGPLARSLGRALPEAVARFGRRLAERYGQAEFTSTEAVTDDKVLTGKGKVNQYLGTLSDFGVAECVDPGKGSKPGRWKIVGEVPEGGAAWLPTVDQLRGEP